MPCPPARAPVRVSSHVIGWGGVGWGGGLLEGRDPWGMLYYGVMVDKTDSARGDGRAIGGGGWMDDATGRWETATRTVETVRR